MFNFICGNGLCYTFGEVSFKICSQFVVIVCFLMIEFWEFFTCSEYISFFGYVMCKCISTVCSLSFLFPNVFPQVEVLNLYEVQFVNFFFSYGSFFWCPSLIQNQKDFLLCFILKVLVCNFNFPNHPVAFYTWFFFFFLHMDTQALQS